ncbi:MAG: hydroxypyruvate isomerase family protein [Candidatus Accumulibacter sp.]|jgi:hydroxypyruvate isomerase|nr:hydroxypyruvate isomerase family protein [Accumulibacter sp.]
MPQFAANLTMMFTELPFPERFAAAAKAGFKAVEFLFPYDHPAVEVAGWLKENGLVNALFNLPPGDFAGGERGIASLPGREREFRDGLARAVEYALALGTPKVHCMAGYFPAGGDRARHRAVYLENLRLAAREMGKHGRIVVIEPINHRDMPGYFLNTQAEGCAILREVGLPNLKLQMDFYHCQIVEGDLSMKFRRNFADIGHVQIASVPDRHEPDEGEVDYRHVFRLLDEMGYGGYVGLEYQPRGRTEDGLGWFAGYR